MDNEILHAIDITLIVPSRWQPRRCFAAEPLLELAQDIRQHGILVPLLIFLNEDGEYELVAGERRLRAVYALALEQTGDISPLAKAIDYMAEHGFMKLAPEIRRKLEMVGVTVPCRLISGEPAQLHEMALIDNLLRQDLNPLEEARGLQDLMNEYGYSQRELAKRIGKSQTYISHRLNLLHLHPDVAGQVTAGEIDATVARELARLEPEVQPAVVQHMAEKGYKSRKAQNFIGKVLELSEPAAWAGGDGDRNAARMIVARLGEMTPAERQGFVLKYAQSNNDTLRLPSGSWEYERALQAVGVSDSAYKKVETVWKEVAPTIGATCQTCRLYLHLERIRPVLDRCRAEDAYWTRVAEWPRCGGEGISTCACYTAEGESLRLRVPQIDFPISDEERAHIRDVGYMSICDDLDVWASLNLRGLEVSAARRAEREDVRRNGLRNALARYIALQDQIAADHVYSQPCAKCVFTKRGATDPQRSCHYQQQAPDERYGHWFLAAIWKRADGAVKIGRCRLFRYKDSVADLPNLEAGSVDVPASAVLFFLKGNGYRGPAWLNVSRAGADENPNWGDVAEYLSKILDVLTPGQRFALMLAWVSAFGADGRVVDGSGKFVAYDPHIRKPVEFSLVMSFSRDRPGDSDQNENDADLQELAALEREVAALG